MNLISFEDAIAHSKSKKRSVLLGNGFSMAFSRDIFSYENLYQSAISEGLFKKTSQAISDFFKKNETFDFEEVMKTLKYFILGCDGYNLDGSISEIAKRDLESLKEVLVEIVARKHPDDPTKITESQYTACFNFLKNFGSVYTTNYDLLLYWVVMHHINLLKFNDGFSSGDIGVEESYVSWDLTDSTSLSMYHLHGGLHIFDAGYEIRKYCWSRTGIRIKNQMLDAVSKGMYPLFVAEGDAVSKNTKILHNGYLLKCLRSLANLRGDLFVYGLGLKENEKHIIDAIVDSTVSCIYVGIFGDPTSVANKLLIRAVNNMVELRQHKIDRSKKRISLSAVFFDSSTAKVWG